MKHSSTIAQKRRLTNIEGSTVLEMKILIFAQIYY